MHGHVAIITKPSPHYILTQSTIITKPSPPFPVHDVVMVPGLLLIFLEDKIWEWPENEARINLLSVLLSQGLHFPFLDLLRASLVPMHNHACT